MCSIAQCDGIWVATHGGSKLILAVGGKGKAGKARAMREAKWRQKKYGPAGSIPTLKAPNCRPMLKQGPAHDRILRKLGCVKKSGNAEKCFAGKNEEGGPKKKKKKAS